MTPLNGNSFRVTGPLCGEFTGRRWIPGSKASDQSFDVFFDWRLNKRFNNREAGDLRRHRAHYGVAVMSLLAQPFIQAQIKENFKALCHWPLWGEPTSDRWIPVGMLCWNWKMLGGNNFHPASSQFLTHWTVTYSSTSKTVVRLYTFLWMFLNIYIQQNTTTPFTNH